MKKTILSIITIGTLAVGFTPVQAANNSTFWGSTPMKILAFWSGVSETQIDIYNNKTTFQEFNHPRGTNTNAPSTLNIFSKTLTGTATQLAGLVALYKGDFKLGVGLFGGGFALRQYGFRQAQKRK